MNGGVGCEIPLRADAASITTPPLNHSLSIIAGRFCTDFADRLNLKLLCEARDRWCNGSTERCRLAY